MRICDLAGEILPNKKQSRGFTLIEILVVMTIIGILMALVIGVAGPVQQQARVYRTRGEIAAIETAMGRFQTDNGFYPASTNISVSGTNYGGDPNADYISASKALFLALTGKHYYYTTNGDVGPNYFSSLKSGQVYNPQPNPASGSTNSLSTDAATYTNSAYISAGDYLMDAWGQPYGFYYDSANATIHSLNNQVTFDLWSTSGETNSDDVTRLRWTANWPNQ